MADSPCDNTYRVTAISLCGTSVFDPVGGSIEETVEFAENRPGGNASACLGIDKYSCKVVAKYQLAQTPVARGTLDDTVFTLKTYTSGAGSVSVTVADTRAGAFNADFDSKPHVYRQEGMFDNTGTENLAPVSVGA